MKKGMKGNEEGDSPTASIICLSKSTKNSNHLSSRVPAKECLQLEVFQTADSRLILAEDPPATKGIFAVCSAMRREKQREREREEADTEFPGA